MEPGWNSMLVKYGEIRSSTESYWRADQKKYEWNTCKNSRKKKRKHGMFNPPRKFTPQIPVSYYNEAFDSGPSFIT